MLRKSIRRVTLTLALGLSVFAIFSFPAGSMEAQIVEGRPGVSGPIMLPEDYRPPHSFAPMAEALRPAVVNIYTKQRVVGSSRLRQYFFGDAIPDPRRRSPGGNLERESLGSGFLISEDGFVVTNQHVIKDAADIQVRLASGEEFSAKVVGEDESTDLAVLKLKTAKSFPYVAFGDSDGLKVGDWVLAIGNPLGLQETVTAGIVSAKGRVIWAGPFDDFIQTDASINPGNSGGPLFDMSGEVVGINTAIIAGAQGIGFAVPMGTALPVIKALIAGKVVARGWLGVSIGDARKGSVQGRAAETGAVVDQVFPNSPAMDAGIRSGDVIYRCDKTEISSASDLIRTIASLAPGSRVKLSVRRGKRSEKRVVKLGDRAKSKPALR